MRAIKASFIDITPVFFHKLCRAFIRPHVEYSFQAWWPLLKKDIKLLEDAQRRSTKSVRCLKDSECEERVQLLKFDSSSCTMNVGDMILVHKILHGSLEGIQWRDFFQVADTSRLRGHSLKLKKERSRLDLRKFTSSQRVVNMWNDLVTFTDIVTAPPAKVFKKLLEAHFKSHPGWPPE